MFSFETVLGVSGVTFQHYGNIFVASLYNREIEIDGQKNNLHQDERLCFEQHYRI